ncbi:MAG: carboxypeptidase-like regulatory domain-containing protein [Acidobacteriota bacterium]
MLHRLAQAAVISGRVPDGDGKPVEKAPVTALQFTFTRGARSLNPAGYTIATDADGTYRFGNLTGGRYYIRAELRAPAVGTYYPSTTDPGAAAAIDVSAGNERSGVDIRQRNDPVFRVRGKAVDASGAPAVNAALNILSEHPIETLTPPARVPRAADGSFEFTDLLPGTYIIRAIPNGFVMDAKGQRAEAKYSGRISVTVTREDVLDVRMPVDAVPCWRGQWRWTMEVRCRVRRPCQRSRVSCRKAAFEWY